MTDGQALPFSSPKGEPESFQLCPRDPTLSLSTNDMTRQQLLDLYFLDARHRLIELAAFLDRLERAQGPADYRLTHFRAALVGLAGSKKNKTTAALLAFSDVSTRPVTTAATQGATGAPPPKVPLPRSRARRSK